MNSKKGYLILATGRIFQGWVFGHEAEPSGEVVFNTSLTGYQEILTDPSYKGQIVAMTPSHIGNTGVNLQDVESAKIFLSGFVVQELSGLTSNWRAQGDLDRYFKEAGVVGLTGVDTRSLTRHLRTLGSVNGLIAAEPGDPRKRIEAAKAVPNIEGMDWVKAVTTDKPYDWKEGSGEWTSWRAAATPTRKKKVVVVDFGVKKNILRCLVDLHCEVTVVPAATSADDILTLRPDGVLLSNGPGDPAAVRYGIQTAKDLVEFDLGKKKGKPVAVFGICLGHQILGLALGGETFKLKFGHHGANHPIKELGTSRVDITTQNHGFAVAGEKQSDEKWSLKGNKDVAVTHVNLNDNSVAGLRHKKIPVFSVQYHPEASAGPHDARHLFERFVNLMEAP